MGELKLSSPAFQDGGTIPAKYTCQGADINPQLNIDGIPKNAKSLVLIVDDPDAAAGDWVHWLMWNVPVISRIGENSVPAGAVQGENDFGAPEYGGPCPGSGRHRYFFKLYALDSSLQLNPNSKKLDVETAMKGHILAQTKLIGLYQKS